MNHKVLVEIFLPFFGESFDVFIPPEMRMSAVVQLISEALSDLLGERFFGGDDTVLCDRVTGMIYSMNRTIRELGIENGSRLMLI